MDKTPKHYNTGVQDLVNSTPVDKIALIMIPTRGVFADSVLAWLKAKSVTASPSRIFQYVPPQRAGVSHYPRQEKIPRIEDPNLFYLIVDDVLDKGTTFTCALKAIEKQGVARDRVWFLAGSLYHDSCHGPTLDKAQVFLSYLGYR